MIQAIRNGSFRSYWTQTSAAENLMEYISLDYDGLSKTIAELIGGIEVPVDIYGFSNDLVTFRNKDDVLTLLIHLGYLTYDEEMETALLFYNNEQALRSVIKLAYFSYRDYYLKFEELPAGNGYADIVYLPKKGSPFPALIIELKWEKSADGQRKHTCIIEKHRIQPA